MLPINCVIFALLALSVALQLPAPASSGIVVAPGRATGEPSARAGEEPGAQEGGHQDDGVKRIPIAEASREQDLADQLRGSPSADFFDFDFMQKYQQLRDRLQSHLDETLAAGAQQQAGEDAAGQRRLSPVILVPGYGGSRLEAKRDKAHVKHYFCERHSDWSNIWIDLKLMLPYMIDCLIDDFRLEFEPSTNTTRDTQGVQVRVREPGDLASVEYLTDIHLTSLGYFAPIIRRLQRALGYKRNLSIMGAPYDFRKAPNELAELFERMRADSEQLVRKFKQPLTFICHSMGCNNVLYFLQQRSAHWKERHVLRVISLAAPWAGSMQAVRATVFGDNLGLPYLFDEAELKVAQQSLPSTMYLYPSERVFLDVPLITTHTGNSSVAQSAAAAPSTAQEREPVGEELRARDFKRFFELINHPEGYLMWLNTKDLLRGLEAPGVELWCLYGQGQPTLGRMLFKGEFPDSEEEDLHEDGDGTVTVKSSSFCQQWAGEQSQAIHAKSFHASHVEMMKDADVLDTIERIVKGK